MLRLNRMLLDTLRRRLLIACCVIAAFVTLASLSGCQIMGYFANGFDRDNKVVDKKAQYLGLEGKTVAVLVAADEYTLFAHPEAPSAVSRAVSRQIAADIKNVTLMNPKDLAAFQKDNMYWHTMPYGDIVKRLKVDRVVFIDMAQFSTHDGSDKTLWRGTVDANVGIIASDNKNPDDLVFQTRTRARFPNDKPVGVLESNDESIKTGVIAAFAQKVSNLFRDHQAPVDEEKYD